MPSFEDAYKSYTEGAQGQAVAGMYDNQRDANLSRMEEEYNRNRSQQQADAAKIAGNYLTQKNGSILSVKRNKKAIMNNSDNIKDFTQYVKSIVEHTRTHNNVAMNIMGDLKNLYVACFDKDQPQPVYTTEMYKKLKLISKYFCIKNETSLTNVQKYNFGDRWCELIDDDVIINPINYVEFRTIKEF